jgi:DNA-binding NtrC family response regulator
MTPLKALRRIELDAVNRAVMARSFFAVHAPMTRNTVSLHPRVNHSGSPFLHDGRGAEWKANQVLVVNSDAAVLQQLSAQLTADGHHVVATTSFEVAKRALRDRSIAMVIAGVRLGAFNGLHLAARCLYDTAVRPVVITHTSSDEWVAHEAEALGATFIADPARNKALLETVRSVVGSAEVLQPVMSGQRSASS